MKKQKLWLWLMLVGNLFMSCSLFLSPIIKISPDITDFFKGFGVSFILMAFYMLVRKRGHCREVTGNS